MNHSLSLPPYNILDQQSRERTPIIDAITNSHVESEVQRMHMEMTVIQINPLFGLASYLIDERLTFVLIPFTDEFIEIYKTIIRPTVENFNSSFAPLNWCET